MAKMPNLESIRQRVITVAQNDGSMDDVVKGFFPDATESQIEKLKPKFSAELSKIRNKVRESVAKHFIKEKLPIEETVDGIPDPVTGVKERIRQNTQEFDNAVEKTMANYCPNLRRGRKSQADNSLADILVQ